VFLQGGAGKFLRVLHTPTNKPDLVVDDLSASTSHASDSELNSIVIVSFCVGCILLDKITSM
jgi:hypothetical protein